MDRDEVDRALARLGAEHEAIETSLLSLQDHAGRRLLEGAELTGTTKERWSAAEASITLLWAYFDAYADALRSAREIRSRRRWSSREDLSELTELLRGASITVAGSATATANAPTLVGTGKLSEQFSLVALVERMNELYASSLDMVIAADAVWSALPARIDLLAAELQRTRRLAHSVGVRPGSTLRATTWSGSPARSPCCGSAWCPTRWPSGFPRKGVRPPAADAPTRRRTTTRRAPWRTCAGRSTPCSPSGRTRRRAW